METQIRPRLWHAISIAFMPPLFSFYVFLALSFSTGSAWFYLMISVIFASMIQGISLLLYGRLSKKA
ncbi:hypothetical protein E6H21_05130 [Candidatus Bathyarchaeota archaeon]|nr:MAG: hypothetical protein E6H21_05130 [Candidatus Bathyarchaeota archaeon]